METYCMTSRPQSFIELSAALTGVTPVLLHGTGMTAAYLRKIDSVVPLGVLERLFDAFSNARTNSGGSDLAEILDDEDLGPVARAITVLWYCGAWTELPESWRARNAAAPADTTGVLSGAAYQAGLQWTVVGAHPAGARQQGFGAWSVEPADLVS
jgi:hypothetical protein